MLQRKQQFEDQFINNLEDSILTDDISDEKAARTDEPTPTTNAIDELQPVQLVTPIIERGLYWMMKWEILDQNNKWIYTPIDKYPKYELNITTVFALQYLHWLIPFK